MRLPGLEPTRRVVRVVRENHLDAITPNTLDIPRMQIIIYDFVRLLHFQQRNKIAPQNVVM